MFINRKIEKPVETKIPFINFENPFYFRPNLKSIFTYQNGLESKEAEFLRRSKISPYHNAYSIRCLTYSIQNIYCFLLLWSVLYIYAWVFSNCFYLCYLINIYDWLILLVKGEGYLPPGFGVAQIAFYILNEEDKSIIAETGANHYTHWKNVSIQPQSPEVWCTFPLKAKLSLQLNLTNSKSARKKLTQMPMTSNLMFSLGAPSLMNRSWDVWVYTGGYFVREITCKWRINGQAGFGH